MGIKELEFEPGPAGRCPAIPLKASENVLAELAPAVCGVAGRKQPASRTSLLIGVELGSEGQ